MIDFMVTLQLENCLWLSDWLGYELGYDNVDYVGMYANEIDEVCYNYYIDMENMRLLEFWKVEDDML